MRVLLFLMAGVSGCAGELAPPEIWIDYSPINLGVVGIDEIGDAVEFHIQLTNRGDELLIIDDVSIRGDSRCSMTVNGPDLTELPNEESAFIQLTYSPPEVGDDHLALEVASNADNYSVLIVPICSRVVETVSDSDESISCIEPPADQADCSE